MWVFGVSSDECLNYAMQNRNEWKDRGQELVNEMIERVGIERNNNNNQSSNVQTNIIPAATRWIRRATAIFYIK
jgi:hypothetical protein